MKKVFHILTPFVMILAISCGTSDQKEEEKRTDLSTLNTDVPPPPLPPPPPNPPKWINEYCVQLKLTRDSLNLIKNGKKTFFQDMDSFEKYLRSDFSKDCDIAFIIGIDAEFEQEKKVSELLNQLDFQYGLFEEERAAVKKDN